MYTSPSKLSEQSRAKIAEALLGVLTDGLDLHGQVKVAHWNIKGPQFPALHPLFDGYATSLSAFNDSVAERAVTLGALARGTARHVAHNSRLQEYPQETTRDMDHVALLSERIDGYLSGLRSARGVAEKE